MTKVFISSTCYDLADLRAEIAGFLAGLGLKPMLSELPATDFEVSQGLNSIELCLKNVAECDFFIAILSQRYGPKIPGYDKSATHLEIDKAKETNRNMLAFVRSTTVAEAEKLRQHQKDSPKKRFKSRYDLELLNFINDYKKLQNGNNWFDSFSTSVDLKEALKQRLKKPIEKAHISGLLQHAKLPRFKLTPLDWRTEGFYINITAATSNESIHNVSFHSRSQKSDTFDVSGLENSNNHFIRVDNINDFCEEFELQFELLTGERLAYEYTVSQRYAGKTIFERKGIVIINGAPLPIRHRDDLPNPTHHKQKHDP